MAGWTTRTSGYKLGVFLLFLSTLLYVVGYASPFWSDFDGYGSSGLWMACYKTFRFGVDEIECAALTGPSAGWFKAVQALQSLGLIGLGIACLFCFVVNCCQTSGSFTRFLELMAGTGGLCGFIGILVYIGKTVGLMMDYSYSWAFGLDLTGSILSIIAAIIIALSNRPNVSGTSTAGMVYYPGGPSQGSQTVVVQHGQGPSYPGPVGAAYPYQPTAPYQPPAGVGAPPPAYPSVTAPPQGYWGAPPQAGAAPQGYSGYNYAQGYSGQPVRQQGMEKM